MSHITLNKKNGSVKTFHIKTRRIICRIIYKNLMSNTHNSHSEMIEKIITDLKNINQRPDWIKKIPSSELKDLINKLNDFQFLLAIHKYLHNLIIIIITKL